jgi:hypothetical protein
MCGSLVEFPAQRVGLPEVGQRARLALPGSRPRAGEPRLRSPATGRGASLVDNLARGGSQESRRCWTRAILWRSFVDEDDLFAQFIDDTDGSHTGQRR